jgi:hypothetical protein
MGEINKCSVVYYNLKKDENFKKLEDIINIIIHELVKKEILNEYEIKNSHIFYNKKKDFFSINIHMTLLNVLFLNKILKKKKLPQKKFIDSKEIINYMDKEIILPNGNFSEIHFSKMREDPKTQKYEMIYSYNI